MVETNLFVELVERRFKCNSRSKKVLGVETDAEIFNF